MAIHFTVSLYFSFHCFMAPILYLILFLTISSSSVEGQPSPGYYPNSKFNSISFEQGLRSLWGPEHQRVDQGALTIWLDRTSGLTKLSCVLLWSCSILSSFQLARSMMLLFATFFVNRKWVQVTSSVQFWLLRSWHQASTRLHSRSYHISLCENMLN